MTPCDQELHLIRETSPSVKRTQNDGSSKDDIIPYHHHRSIVHFSSPHDWKCYMLLILLIEVLCTSSYHSLSAYIGLGGSGPLLCMAGMSPLFYLFYLHTPEFSQGFCNRLLKCH